MKETMSYTWTLMRDFIIITILTTKTFLMIGKVKWEQITYLK
ncbi:hypothetical protein SAMN04487902_101496 [Prevotella sp. ne3005]|nr:hypothetical protein SAMN04487902_101496 [Prevotella sp. ne3005]